MDNLHPIIHAAGAEGRPPDWAVMSPARIRHAGRVGKLMGDWAEALGRDAATRIRWRAAGLLHDALKEAGVEALRPLVDGTEEWPDPLLHGPACANRLRAAGVDDEPLLRAIAFHTTGHRDLRALGQALYMADFLEPGRLASGRERTGLRRRMPDDWHAVLVDVATAKIGVLIDAQIPVSAVTAGFWEAITAPR
ncbi:MAG: HD domain-containing protein [Gemmatimonadetes bacterium]|nr:HD domain-containing protein [Candidatus Palauibacter australiensis]